jgi:hypothetical protein
VVIVGDVLNTTFTLPVEVVTPVPPEATGNALDKPVIEPPVTIIEVKVTPVIEPPVILAAVMVYVPSRIPSPQSLICDIISRMVSFTADGSIPSGAPSGGAAVLLEGVREYFVYAMICP